MADAFTIPASTLPAVPQTSQITQDLFGKDILFTDDFQLTAGGDYVTISDEANLKKAIYRRLLTRPGEYRFRPEYGAGLATYAKKGLNLAILDNLRQLVLNQLAQEKRIESVDEVTVQETTIGGVPAVKVYVRVRALGRVLSFEPYTFVKE
jgi:phage baseplate assembly protein W